MIHMLLAAKGAGFVECHLRIQCLVSGLVGYDTPVFQDSEIRTLKYLVLSRTGKNKFHVFSFHCYDIEKFKKRAKIRADVFAIDFPPDS